MKETERLFCISKCYSPVGHSPKWKGWMGAGACNWPSSSSGPASVHWHFFYVCGWGIWRYSGNLKCHNVKEFICVQTPALEVQLFSCEICSISQEKNYRCGGCQWFCVHRWGKSWKRSPKRLSGRQNVGNASGCAPPPTPTQSSEPYVQGWSAATFAKLISRHIPRGLACAHSEHLPLRCIQNMLLLVVHIQEMDEITILPLAIPASPHY